MKVEELLVYGKAHCHSDFAKILLADLLGLNPLELLNYLSFIVDSEKCERYKRAVLAIENGTPLQYALGKVNFYGNEFIINENVLIPRFETEELVENTVKYSKEFFKDPVDIIDLGCGSGVIGLTLEEKISTNSVDLIDISDKALEIANKNCEKLNSKAHILQSDMFESVEKKYDIIISNPPYIRDDEEIEEIVKNNEPSIALYGGKDGLDFYRKILSSIKPYMKERCLIAFEIGMNQQDQIRSLIQQYLDNVEVICKKDLSEKDRMIFIFKQEGITR